ncbi:MAG: TolC family protein, partial [Pseudomonadota bacterium]
MMRLRILSLALGAGLAGGCATLAPEHERPAPSVPDAFPQAGALPEGQPAATIPWRDYFTDPRLREVIAQALENNRDLRVAAFNIEKARAQYRIRSADRFPAVGADGSQTVQRLPGDLTTTGETMTQRQYSATLGFAAWELDFFGRIRNLSEQSVEQYLATEEARRSLRISLIAEVAQAWMTLAADRERLALARSTYETREKSYDLTRRSFELGAVSALDLRQSETLLAGVPLRAEWLPETLGEPTAAVAEMTAGVPSEVLARRPDIL